jgi:Nucleotidyltransferase domain
MDVPADVAELLDEFAAGIQPVAGAIALYVGGSLATGDYRPGISDLDLVAVIGGPLGTSERQRLTELHRRLIARWPAAAKLHCVYVPKGDLTDLAAEHLTWGFGELFPRPLSGVARAELLGPGFAVFGPPPSALIPPMSRGDVRQAARTELSGYWTGALRRPMVWLEDVYVDLGMTVLARADAALAGDGVITKREALTRLDRFGVPPRLVDEIRRRRDGEDVPVPPFYRLYRAVLAHHLMARGIATLLRD